LQPLPIGLHSDRIERKPPSVISQPRPFQVPVWNIAGLRKLISAESGSRSVARRCSVVRWKPKSSFLARTDPAEAQRPSMHSHMDAVDLCRLCRRDRPRPLSRSTLLQFSPLCNQPAFLNYQLLSIHGDAGVSHGHVDVRWSSVASTQVDVTSQGKTNASEDVRVLSGSAYS